MHLKIEYTQKQNDGNPFNQNNSAALGCSGGSRGPLVMLLFLSPTLSLFVTPSGEKLKNAENRQQLLN